MGVEELPDARSTRRSTRSSTKVTASTPVTPPTPKRQPATPSSSSRAKKNKAQDDEPEDEEVVEKVSPKQTPPRKRQKLSEIIKAEELKNNSERVESEADDEKADVIDAKSQEANGSVDTMEIDEEKVKETPFAEEKPDDEGKPIFETIPEEASQVIEATVETVKPVQEEKPLQAETESEEAPLVKETPQEVEEPVEQMEVDSAAKAVTDAPVIVSKVEKSPPEIIVSAPKPEVASVVSDSVEQSVTSSSEEKESASKVDSVQVPEVSSEETKCGLKAEARVVIESTATAEQTQVFEISSDNPSKASEEVPAVAEKPAVDAIETLTTGSVTEQSKIESTQGNLFKAIMKLIVVLNI